MPARHEVDATLLWPHMTLGDVEALRNAAPLSRYEDLTTACPVCGDEAFITTDRRSLYCLWTCRRGMPGPASDLLLAQLARRHRRRRAPTPPS